MKLAFFFFTTGLILAGAASAVELPSEQEMATVSHTREWRHLLHFSNGLLSDKSSVKGDKFFLAKNGSKSLGDELTETLKKMSDGDAEVRKNTQCRFPARREFLFTQFPQFKSIVVDCPELSRWVEKLGADKISVIFASGYLNSAPSSFGHTFLKLKNDKNNTKDLLNYGVNFSARTDEQDGVLYAWKGLLGFFPANFSLLQYHLMIREYVNLEGRDLWEYELNLTSDEIKMILYHLLELEQGYFDYYFIDENCSSMILRILQIARPKLELISEDEFFTIPIDTLKPIEPLIANTIYRPSLKTTFTLQWTRLSTRQQDSIVAYINGDKQQLLQMDAQTTEVLQAWASIQESKNPTEWKELSYSVALHRIKLENLDPVQVPIPDGKPMISHKSSQLGLGIGRFESRTVAEFQWMPAFHERLARAEGLPPFSEIKILNTELMIDKKIELKNFDLIEVLSSSAVHPLEKPLSWGFSVGQNKYLLSEQEEHVRVLGQVGYSFGQQNSRIFIGAKAGAQQVLEARLEPTLGPVVIVWLNLHSKFRFNAEADFQYLKHDYLHQQKYQLAIDLSSQLWLSVVWQGRKTKEHQSEESSLYLKYFF